MLWHITGFEIRYWLRSRMLWVFALVVAALIFGLASSDNLARGALYRNAPFVIEHIYALIGLLTLLMATAFVNSAASRDFTHNTYEIVFSTPLRRRDFLFGRFLGATLISVVPMLGVSVGILLAGCMPWAEPARYGPVYWGAHFKGILVFAIPNTFFVAAVLFAIAVLARNELVSFVGALGLLAGYGAAETLVLGLEASASGASLILLPSTLSRWPPSTGPWPRRTLYR